MSKPRSAMTLEELQRARDLERARQSRKRQRDRRGDRLLTVPADIADELGEDEKFDEAALAILRQHLQERDGA